MIKAGGVGPATVCDKSWGVGPAPWCDKSWGWSLGTRLVRYTLAISKKNILPFIKKALRLCSGAEHQSVHNP